MKKQQELQEALTRLKNSTQIAEQKNALTGITNISLGAPAQMLLVHDALLSVIAFPFNEENHVIATRALDSIIESVKAKASNSKWQYALSGSGLPYTELICQFSARMAYWLTDTFPRAVSPFEMDKNGELLQEILQAALPGIEFHETTQGKNDGWNRIGRLSGHFRDEAALRWLLNLLEKQPWPLQVRNALYDRLKIYIRWKLVTPMYTRSLLRFPVSLVHYGLPETKRPEASAIIRKPLAKAAKPGEKEAEKLIRLARMSLAFYSRETDPVTYADSSATRLYDMGDGLQILLTGMNRQKRLALETYLGYMAIRNGVPVAYGGGWIFGHRCKIGINIYPPFRGKGSERIFCEIMRLYTQAFDCRCFIVKPYQFGKGNPEGLKSGAFWFYYKLGFRPVDDRVSILADNEWNKISTNKQYRTSQKTLKKFTACPLEWTVSPLPNRHAAADDISIAITEMIKEKFNGDRASAINQCRSELKKSLSYSKKNSFSIIETKTLDNFSLLFKCITSRNKWTTRKKTRFADLILLKTNGDEYDYIKALQQFTPLWILPG